MEDSNFSFGDDLLPFSPEGMSDLYESVINVLPDDVTYQVQSLLDLAADIVGKTFSCQDLDSLQAIIRQKRGGWSQVLDDQLMKKIACCSFPRHKKSIEPFVALSSRDIGHLWKNAENILMAETISKMTVFGFTANASMTTADCHPITVDLTFERQQITLAKCSNCSVVFWCHHVLAAVLYHIRYPNKVERYPPLSNLLSAMTKDKLQKLLQVTIAQGSLSLEGCLNTIETIQDNTSPLSNASGAVDVTEGYVSKDDRITERCKQAFLIDLKEEADIDRKVGFFYTQEYDWDSKKDSEFQLFVNKILGFIKAGNFTETIDLFKTVLQELVQKMDGRAKNYNIVHSKYILHTVHDVAHTVALCLLHPDFPEHLSKEMLNMAEYLEGLELLKFLGVLQSSWTELPHLVHTCVELCHPGSTSLNKPGQDLTRQLLGEVLATQYVPRWPEELFELTSGDVSWRDSFYNESTTLMLWRAESILVTENESEHHKILRMLPLILRKLAMSAPNSKFSMLGKFTTLSSWEDIFDTGHNIPALRGHKYAKCEHVAKRRKLCPSGPEYTLLESQMAYGILYSLYMKEICEASTGKQFGSLDVDIAFYWLALEMSSMRLSHNLCDTEHAILGKLEDRVIKTLKNHYDDTDIKATDCLHWYLTTLANNFEEIPHNCLLLQLFSTMMSIVMKRKLHRVDKNLQERILCICCNTIKRVQSEISAGSLSKVLLVLKKQVSLDPVIEMFWECADPTKNREWLIQTISSLATLFEQVTLCDTGIMDVKVFKHFKDEVFCYSTDLAMVNAVYKYAVSAYKNHEVLQFAAMKVICRHAPYIGLSCLDAIVTQVVPMDEPVTTFKSTHVAEVLCSLRSCITSCSSPQEVLTFAMNYCFKRPNMPSKQMSELLDLYKLPCFSSEDFLDAVGHIIQHAGYVPSKTLFTVAKMFEEKCTGGDDTNRSVSIISVIRKAFEMLKGEETWCGSTDQDLKWVYTYATQGGILWSDLLDIIHTNGSTHPRIVLSLLEENNDVISSIEETQKAKLLDTVTAAFEMSLYRRIRNCRASNYRWLIKEMKKDFSIVSLLGEGSKNKIKDVLKDLACSFKRKRRLATIIDSICSEM